MNDTMRVDKSASRAKMNTQLTHARIRTAGPGHGHHENRRLVKLGCDAVVFPLCCVVLLLNCYTHTLSIAQYCMYVSM